jgi:hypothetical protein
MTAGTPTDLWLAWFDSNRQGGFDFATGQEFTLTVGATTLSYTLLAGDVASGNDATIMTKLVNGLNAAAPAGTDFQLLHPINDGTGMNSFHVMWNDASAVNRDEFSLTCDDGVTVSNMRDYGLWTRYGNDHDGTTITLTTAINITATASGTHSSADIVLDNLVGNISTITANASGGNMVGTVNYYHDAFGSDSSYDFAGASADAMVRVTGGVSNVVITAENIEDNALVALSQTVQGGTATASGDGRTTLTIGDQTLDTINLAAMHTGTWGAFDLNLAMADADLGAADSAELSASLITINNFNGDRDSINLFSPYDQTTYSWAGNYGYVTMHYTEVVADAGTFGAFLTAADTALGVNTDAIPDYYFGVVGSNGYLAYDMGGTGITGVIKLAGVTSFDAANVGNHDNYLQLAATPWNAAPFNDAILNDATRIYYATDGNYDASDMAIDYTSAGLIDSLGVKAYSDVINAADTVLLQLTEGAGGDIIFRQATIQVSADTAGDVYTADAKLEVNGARGTIEHLALHAYGSGNGGDGLATATFAGFTGAVHEIEVYAEGDNQDYGLSELNMRSLNTTALTESVQNLWMSVLESADATANLNLSSGSVVVKTEVAMSTSIYEDLVTLNIQQVDHGGDVFATSHIQDVSGINATHDYQNSAHATFDLTYTGATADKVSLGQMVWDANASADVFTVGNFEGQFKLTVDVVDADLVGTNAGNQTTLLANMLTIDGFDTGGTSLDTTNAWLDDTLSIIGTTIGTDHLAINTANVGSMESFLTAADTALDTDTVYFGVVNGNGYLAYDQDKNGITGVIEFLGMTDLDYTRINGMAS